MSEELDYILNFIRIDLERRGQQRTNQQIYEFIYPYWIVGVRRGLRGYQLTDFVLGKISRPISPVFLTENLSPQGYRQFFNVEEEREPQY